jgi:hypothetical protein
MATKNLTITGDSDFDLISRETIIKKMNQLPTDQLKRLGELAEIPKAKSYLESAVKFQGLKILLK